MIKIIERIISILKGDSSYRLDTTYSIRQLFFIVWYRFLQFLRGFLVKLQMRSSGIVFCGRKVIIEHGYLIKAGKNLILEDSVHINALSHKGVLIGSNVTIAKYSVMVCTGVVANKGIGISIGNNSAIGAQSFLGGQGGIEIGNDVIMGPQVKIFSENHHYDLPEILIRKQGEFRKQVVIGDNCWIGAGVTILAGVIVGKGCVIAAGSVVTKSLPENVVAAGIPAKNIKSRMMSNQLLDLK